MLAGHRMLHSGCRWGLQLLLPSSYPAFPLRSKTFSSTPQLGESLVGESMRTFLTEAEKQDKNWARGAANPICSRCGACHVQPTFTTIHRARHRSARGARAVRHRVRTNDRVKGGREDFELLGRAVPAPCRSKEDSRVSNRLSVEIHRLR